MSGRGERGVVSSVFENSVLDGLRSPIWMGRVVAANRVYQGMLGYAVVTIQPKLGGFKRSQERREFSRKWR